MTAKNVKSIALRGVSLFVAVVFLATTLIWDPTVVLAAGQSFFSADPTKFQKDLQNFLYSLPQEIGTATDISIGTRKMGNQDESRVLSPEPRFVIHIRDAHANPDAQRNIYEILKFLSKKYPDLAIGIEGAAGVLHPEYLDLFREFPVANQAIIEDLRSKGELTGAELFEWEQYKNSLQATDYGPQKKGAESFAAASNLQSSVSGVEDSELYRENLKTYRELLFKREEIQSLLNPVRAVLEKEGSRILNAELRDFLKERARRKNGQYQTTRTTADADLQAYVRYLQKQVSKILTIDLADPVEQLRFPNLIRLVLLEKNRSENLIAPARDEWLRVLGELRQAAREDSEKEFVRSFESYGVERGLLSAKASDPKKDYGMAPALYPRRLLEQLYLLAQKRNVKLAEHKAFLKSFGFLTLQAEIDITGLMKEMGVLEERVIEKLTRTDTEKALVKRLENFELFEKLLSVELSREEYHNSIAVRSDLETFAKNSVPLQKSLAKALHFYDVTLQRDRALVKNALSLTMRRTPYAVPRVVVLITGGFHSEGIRNALAEAGTGYAELTPRMSRTDHGEMYQKVMADSNADLSAYFKVRNPFQTKQEAILFKEALEVATTALSETYQVKGQDLAEKVQRAFDANPILSGAVRSELLGNVSESTLRFTPKPGVQTLTPQSSTIPAVPVMASTTYSRAVADPAFMQGSSPADVTFESQTGSTHLATVRTVTMNPAGLTQTGSTRVGDLTVGFGTISGQGAPSVAATTRTEVKVPVSSGRPSVPNVPRAARTTMAFSWSLALQGFLGGAPWGLIPAVAGASVVRSELREETTYDVLEVPPEGSVGGPAVIFAAAEGSKISPDANPEQRLQSALEQYDQELSPKDSLEEERWVAAQAQYGELLYLLRQFAGQVKQLVLAAKETETQAERFIDAQERGLGSVPAFRKLKELDLAVEEARQSPGSDRKGAQQELDRFLEDSELKNKAVFRAYLSALAVFRRKNAEETTNFASGFFLILAEAMSLGTKSEIDKLPSDEKVTRRLLWTGQKDVAPLSLERLETMPSSELNTILQNPGLRNNLWLRQMVADNKSVGYFFYQHVVEKLKVLREQYKNLPPQFSAAFADAESFSKEILAELTKIEAYQLHFRTVSNQDGFGVIAQEPLSPQQYLSLRAQYGDRLKYIVMRAERVGADSTSTSHTKIIIQADFNPPVLILMEGASFDHLVAQVQEGQKDPLLLLTTSGGKPKVVLQPNKENRAAYDRESKRKVLWAAALRRWLSQSQPKVSGKFAINLMPALLGVLDRITEIIGLDHLSVGLYRLEMQNKASVLTTIAMIRALGEEFKSAQVESFSAPISDAERQHEFFKWLERPEVQAQLAMDQTEMETLLTHPVLRGEVVRVRTPDYRIDKNPDLYNWLLAESVISDSHVGGLEMYYTGFGRLKLLSTLVAAILANAQAPDGQKAALEMVFPMIKHPAEIRYIQERVLPVALAAARQRLIVFGKDPAQLSDAVLLKGISFGMMLETPEAYENLAAFLENDFIHVVNVGLNDFQLQHTIQRLGLKEGEMDRPNPWYGILVQEWDAEFVDKIRRIVETFDAYNRNHPDKPKKICFCGEIAADTRFAPLLAVLEQVYPQAGFSVSMSPGRVPENVFARDQALRLERQIMNDPSVDLGAQQIRGKQVLNARLKALQEVLIGLEAWQQDYERHGYYLGFQRQDPDVVGGPGSAAQFLFLKNMVRALLDNPEYQKELQGLQLSANGQLSHDELKRILGFLEKQDVLFSHETAKLVPAFDFLVSLRDIFEEQGEKMPDGPYASGRLVRSMIPQVLIQLAERGQLLERLTPDEASMPDEDLFLKRYYEHSTLVFESVTRVILELFYQVFKDSADPSKTRYADEPPLAVIDLRSEIRGGGSETSKVWIRSRPGIQFEAGRGFYYGVVRALHASNAEALFQEHPEWMVRIFYLAAQNNIRVSHRVQKALRKVMAQNGSAEYPPEVRQRMLREFEGLLKLDQNINYAMLRLHRFGILDLLIPGYQDIRNRFLSKEQQYTADNVMLRTLEALERLRGGGRRPFQNSGSAYWKVRANPDLALPLRLAVVLEPLMVFESERAGVAQPSFEFLQGAVANHFTAMGWRTDSSLVVQVARLIWVQRYMEKKDFGNLQEKVPAVEFLAMAMGEFQKDPAPASLDPKNIYHMIYAMAAASRVAHTTPENLPLLLREGLRSSLGHLDIIFAEVGELLPLPVKASDTAVMGRFSVDAIAEGLKRKEQKFREDGEENFHKNQLGRLREVISVEFNKILENYLQGISQAEPKQKTQDPLKARLRELFTGDPEALGNLYQRYAAKVSAYYEKDLSAEEVLQQLIHLAHLEWLLEQGDTNRVAMLALPVGKEANHPYELILSFPLNESGVASAFSRVLNENGFVIESINPRQYDDDRAVTIVFLGSFSDPEGNISAKLARIHQDLAYVFRREKLDWKDITIPWLTSAAREQRAWVRNRFLRADKLYGGPLKVSVPTGWRFHPAEVKFNEESQGEFAGLTRIEVTATDRVGLFAAVTELFAGKLFNFKHVLNIRYFRFDNTNYDIPRIIFWVEDSEFPGKPISASIVDIVKQELPRFLNASTGFSLDEKPVESGAAVPVLPIKSVLAPSITADEVPSSKPPEVVTSSTEVSAAPVAVESSAAPQSSVGKVWSEIDYQIGNEMGLHVRPCSMLVKVVTKAFQPEGAFLITSAGEKVDAKRAMDLVMTATEAGSMITLRFEGLSQSDMNALIKEIEAMKDANKTIFIRQGDIRSGRSEERTTVALGRSELRAPVQEVLRSAAKQLTELEITRRQAERGITKVLIVDDDRGGQILLRHMLARFTGIQYESASNGEEGLRKALVGDYDLVWTDFHMPMMDGAQMAQAIRTAGKTIPIVLWSTGFGAEQTFLPEGRGVNDAEKQAFQLLREKVITKALSKNRTPFTEVAEAVLTEMNQYVKETAEARLQTQRVAGLIENLKLPASLNAQIDGVHPFAELTTYWEHLQATPLPLVEMMTAYRAWTQKYGSDQRYAADSPEALVKDFSKWRDIFGNKLVAVQTFLQLWDDPARRPELASASGEDYRKVVVDDGRDMLLLWRLRQLVESPETIRQVRDAFQKVGRSEVRAAEGRGPEDMIARYQRQAKDGITRVLVVDDDEMGRTLVGRLFKKWGEKHSKTLVVNFADNGEAGLQQALAGDFDLVLTDWSMPRKDGAAMAQDIYNQGKRIPVVLWSTRFDSAQKLGKGEPRNGNEKQIFELLQRGVIQKIMLKMLQQESVVAMLDEMDQKVKKEAAKILPVLSSLSPSVKLARTVTTRTRVARLLDHLTGNALSAPSNLSVFPESSSYRGWKNVHGMFEDILTQLRTLNVPEAEQRIERDKPSGERKIFVVSYSDGQEGDEVVRFGVTPGQDWAEGKYRLLTDVELNELFQVLEIVYREFQPEIAAAEAWKAKHQGSTGQVTDQDVSEIKNLVNGFFDKKNKLNAWLHQDIGSVHRILVVGDDSAWQDSLASQLTGQGYEVFSATSDGEAQSLIRERRIDAIILQQGVGMGGQILEGMVERSAEKIPVLVFGDPIPGQRALPDLWGNGVYVESASGADSNAVAAFLSRFGAPRSESRQMENINPPPAALVPTPQVSFNHVLVVDDELSIRKIMVRMITSVGVRQVDMAADGREALEMITANPGRYDLIISDVPMPRRDGLSLVEDVRALMEGQRRPMIPVILMSGYMGDNASVGPKIDRLKTQGVPFTFLSKPFVAKDIQTALAGIAVLPQRAGSAQVEKLPGSTPEVRGELRLMADQEVRLPEGILPEQAVDETAWTLGTFSVPGVTYYFKTETVSVTIGGETMTIDSSAAAEAWVTWRVVEHEIANAPTSGISNARLQKILEVLRASLPAGFQSKFADAMQGPQVHANLSNLTDRDWKVLVPKLAVTLGTLVTLNGKLLINVNMDAQAIRRIEQEILDLAKQEGIVLAPDQLRLIPVSGRDPFALSGATKADALVAQERGLLDQVIYRKGLGARWVTDDGGNMETLAVGLTTILYAALDERVDRINIHRPSEYNHGAMFAAVLNAIQGYVAILRAA